MATAAFGMDPQSARWPLPVERFARLRERFEEDLAFVSSVHEMVQSAPFRDIVAMGRDAVPCLEDDLRRSEAPWVAWVIALRQILGDGPDIPDDEAGDRARVLARWVAWFNRPT